MRPTPSRNLAPVWHGDGGNVVAVDKMKEEYICKSRWNG